MSNYKPLVRKEGVTTELQAGDDVKILLEDRVERLEDRVSLLIKTLMMYGIELPEELI